ncbi:MAG: hypothetical protein IID18_10310 [Nitrospinae bacterium]|nr:hypothetical protein [Nitrospinota bacterium]
MDHPGKDCFMIADRLHRMVKKAKIIITIRNQATMLDSLYRQYIHGGFRGDFDTVFASGRIPLEYLFYDKVISHYRKLFGAEAVYVGLFEEIQHHKEKFLSGLTGFMGVEIPIFDPSVFSHRDNQGLSEFSLAALRVFNAVYPSSFPTQKWLHRWVRTADAKILLKLSPRRLNKLDDSMLDCCRPGNRALVEQLGLPLATLYEGSERRHRPNLIPPKD